MHKAQNKHFKEDQGRKYTLTDTEENLIQIIKDLKGCELKYHFTIINSFGVSSKPKAIYSWDSTICRLRKF